MRLEKGFAMKGVEFAEVRDAILNSFSADDFDMLLFERFEFVRDVQVASGPFKMVVANVLRRFMEEGTDALLIAEIAAKRPLKTDVQEVYRKYAQALVNDARQTAVDDARLKAIERYGLVPKVTLQKAGVQQLPARTASATNEGFERKVHAEIPFLEPAAFRETLFAMEGRVCRIEFESDSTTGTGFLVGPDLVLSNHHVLKRVIDDPTIRGTVRFRFDFKKLANGMESDGIVLRLAQDWLIDASPPSPSELANQPDQVEPTADELDFALVRLERPIGSESGEEGGAAAAGPGPQSRGWIQVPTAAPALAPHMPVLILQHPKGESQLLAMDTQGVLSVRANRVRYATNTEAGSSGSPVFDIRWRLIALHHYGDPASGALGEWNQGIPIWRIRERLQRVGKVGVLSGAGPGQ